MTVCWAESNPGDNEVNMWAAIRNHLVLLNVFPVCCSDAYTYLLSVCYNDVWTSIPVFSVFKLLYLRTEEELSVGGGNLIYSPVSLLSINNVSLYCSFLLLREGGGIGQSWAWVDSWGCSVGSERPLVVCSLTEEIREWEDGLGDICTHTGWDRQKAWGQCIIIF